MRLLRRPAGRVVACHAVRWLARGVLRLLDIEVRTAGRLPPGPALLVANHLSWIDIVAVLAHYDCTFVAKDEVRDWPVVGTLGKALGVIWIDRRRKRDLIRAVAALSDALQRGDRVLLFPEGTTSTGREVLPFRSSLVEAAVQVGVPVVPVALSTHAEHGQGETLCWVGDETLWAHLPRVRALHRAVFEVQLLPAMDAGPTRKVRSALARGEIIAARRHAVRSASRGNRRQRLGEAELATDRELRA